MKEELKRIFKSKMLFATLVGVVILPLIYGGLYLWAFWDPYGKMENLPVAIVNEDKCAYKLEKKENKEYCFGQELIDKLGEEKQMNWQFVDKQTAEIGLENKDYYTLAIIPEDFSKNILSVDGDNTQQAKIEFKSRQASSFMAAKFSDTAFIKIKAALNEKISKEYFDNIFAETRDSVEDLKKAVDGASDLADGLAEAKDGSKDLYDGIDKLNSGLVDLRGGLNSLYDGGEKLTSGANDAYTGTLSLLTGSVNLNNGLTNLSLGTSQLSGSLESLSLGQIAVINYLNVYITNHPEASGAAELQAALSYANAVNTGISQVKTGLVTSNNGVSQLLMGSESLKNGLSNLSIGVRNLATGSASLKNGLASAVNGNNDLITGVEKIKDGSEDLVEGLDDASSGSEELKDKLAESVKTTKEKTDEKKNEIQSDVMSKPVDIHDISIDIVNNNGTGFAPYFIPLALWVGGMAIFFLVDLEDKKKNKKIVKHFLPKILVSLIVSTIQTGTLGLVLIGFLGLKVNYIGWLILFVVLLGWASTLIQMFLTLVWGLPGKFIGIVLLMLQLTSSAGSYPAETLPKFFQNISKFLPMTYAVSALREIISGSNLAVVKFDIKMILFFIILPFGLIWGYLLKKRK